MLGLLATAKLAGQVPVLFNVVVNPAANTVSITPNANEHPSQPALPLLQEYASLFISDGITLINLLPASSTASTSAFGVPIPQTLRVYEYFGDPNDPSVAATYQPNPATFTSLAIYGPGSLSVSGLPNDPFGNPGNPGKNVNLFNESLTTFSLFDIRFSKPDDTSSLTITFTESGALPASASSYTGPHYVYAGINTVFSVESGGIAYNSLLGTYNLTVVPEPSTYAAIAGGLGLVAAVLHRRRQRARATAA